MSRAFVKETADSAPPPERMLSEGPNPVTPEGFAQIEAQVARLEGRLSTETNVLLRETLARDLRYWAAQKLRAQIVRGPSGPAAGTAAAFGSRVTILRGGKRQSFRIVGEDEARPAEGTISWRSPLAQAAIGAEPGDIVEMANGEIEIISVEEAVESAGEG